MDRLKGELPVPLLPTLSGVGPVVTLDLAPEVIRTIIAAGIWAAFFPKSASNERADRARRRG